MPSSIQQQFLNKIKALVPHEQLAASIARALGISSSEAYKKINGSSLLRIDQIEKLCNYYKIDFSYSQATGKQQWVGFEFTEYFNDQNTITDYLDSLVAYLQLVKLNKTARITCATDDIPVFHLFKYPELATFKLYFWENRTREKSIRKQPFSPDLFSNKEIDKTYLAYELYNSISSTEIWTGSTLFNTLHQIQYAVEANWVKDKIIAKKICDQAKSVIQDIAQMAMTGSKNSKLSAECGFEWFYCDIIGNITYITEWDNFISCHQRFNTFNTLQTTDKKYCNEVKKWMNSLLTEAISFSGHSEKQRNNYLADAEELFNKTIRKIS